MKHRAVWLFYTVVALLVMGPMIARGYILTLDLVFTPKLPASAGTTNLYLFQGLLHVLNFVVPSQVIEKFIIFLILLLSGVGMHRLVRTKLKGSTGAYFAGLFYAVNPFTYERWMAGQYLLLAGYALVPWLLSSLLRFIASPSRKAGVRLGLWYTAVALVSVHILVMAAIAGLVIIVVELIGNKKTRAQFHNPIPYTSALIVFLVLNSYWFVGVIKGTSSISQTINSVTGTDLTAFATAAGQRGGVLLNVLGLHGLWLENATRYYFPDKNVWLWLLGFVLLATVIILGIRRQWHKEKRLAIAFMIIGVIGFVLATGVNAPIFGGLNRWLINNVPLGKGFREPEKFAALLALAYCYFSAYGVDWLTEKAKALNKDRRELAPMALLLIPLIYTSTMPFGFVGQLKPASYPASWTAFNNQLKAQPASGKVLFLPWHEYMSYDFEPRIIANPAPDFFSADVIAGTNAQFGGVNDPTPTPTSLFIENHILAQPNLPGMGERLASIGVQYVLLSGGYGFQSYGFLNHQSQLQKISSQPSLTIYRNLEYKA